MPTMIVTWLSSHDLYGGSRDELRRKKIHPSYNTHCPRLSHMQNLFINPLSLPNSTRSMNMSMYCTSASWALAHLNVYASHSHFNIHMHSCCYTFQVARLGQPAPGVYVMDQSGRIQNGSQEIYHWNNRSPSPSALGLFNDKSLATML